MSQNLAWKVGENNMTRQSLPAQFGELEPFVADWALETEEQRLKKLIGTSIDALRVFYDAIFGRSAEIRDYLSERKLDALSAEEKTLFFLLLTFMEVAHPIELNWKETDIDDAFALDRMSIGHFDIVGNVRPN
jgi:hypothetical protein